MLRPVAMLARAPAGRRLSALEAMAMLVRAPTEGGGRCMEGGAWEAQVPLTMTHSASSDDSASSDVAGSETILRKFTTKSIFEVSPWPLQGRKLCPWLRIFPAKGGSRRGRCLLLWQLQWWLLVQQKWRQ